MTPQEAWVARNRVPAARAIRGLLPVLRFARPHAMGIALSILLMAVQAGANVGRLVLLYPVLTRVLLPAGVELVEGEREARDEAEGSGNAEVDVVRRRMESGALGDWLEAVVTGANRVTAAWVPEKWVDEVAPPDDPSPVAQEARAQRLDQYATLLSVLLLFVVFIVVMCAAAYGESYVAEKVRLQILMDVREALCRTLLDQPVGFYDNRRRGELVQRVLGDVEGYATALRLVMDGVIRGLLHVITTVVLLALLSWQLSLVCLLGIPFFVPMRNLMRRVLKRSHRRQLESEKRVQVLLQIFSGIRTVKAYGTEERRVREFRDTDELVTMQSMKVQRAKSAADALIAFINNFLAMVLAVGGGFVILRGLVPVNPAELVTFLVLVGNLYQPLKRVIRHMTMLTDAIASVERTNEYLGMPSGSPDRPDAVAFPGVRKEIRFENVTFSYVPDSPVLHDVSFTVPKGAIVALVGPSGAGKSTLCDLLLRFYDPDGGRITVDGADVKGFKRATLLARTAVVTQSPFLFHTSIRDNIQQGRFEAGPEEIEAAAKDAQIHEFIATLPAGYETEVGEMGVRLSGGQRQRITIARALVRNPEILVLDEATSSLDTGSEKAVQQALDRLQEGRTTLVVAHRLSTVRHATKIVVLDEGKVVEEGTHDDLIGQGGLYARLVEMQDLR